MYIHINIYIYILYIYIYIQTVISKLFQSLRNLLISCASPRNIIRTDMFELLSLHFRYKENMTKK